MITLKTIKITFITLKIKLLWAFKFSSIAAMPIALIEYYSGVYLENKIFMVGFFSSFMIDIVLGIWKHLKNKTFDFSLLIWGALTKLFVSIMAMILFNALASAEGIGETGLRLYVLLIGKLLVLIYINGSAWYNMYFITKGKFPPVAWMKKMKGFNESLDPTTFTNPTIQDNEKTNDLPGA